MDVAGDLGLTGIKKYQKCAGQFQAKVDWLYKNWIPALRVFVKYSQKTHDNEKITENIMIRYNIDSKLELSIFVQLHGFIYCWKIDDKDITNTNKLIKEMV